MKQLAQNIEKVIEKGKKTRQPGDWVCIFSRQYESYPHLASWRVVIHTLL
jgi:hypothetical protein